ncbi:MAG TPA: hypothetical protein VJR87_06350 [Allosphingosinicella sp.]|nr:hypothetical protein [Allosphingosinicella sp.]
MGEAAGGLTEDEPKRELGGDRLSVLLSATVQSRLGAIPVRLREVSRTEALVEAAVVPPVGSLVRFSRGEIDVAARVICAGKASFELRFHETIDERALFIAVGGRRSKGGPARCRPLFPEQNYIGFVDFDDEEGNGLPFSKH